ncbi:MAG TPA: 30S ribosome-binding factor RbfA [Chthoniobacteraceae bacterium]|nr:30S ribosome-binding factor RbfA [Chthoniobacteraceae bacterium]
MKHRLKRVQEVIKRELSELIQREITFATLVTVQDVESTPDLKHAYVFVSVLGSEEEKERALAKLHDNRKVFQAAMAKRVVLKYTPQLHFKFDEALERGTRVINLLEEIQIPDDES